MTERYGATSFVAVALAGSGAASSVVSTPPGIDCRPELSLGTGVGTTCAASFAAGTAVTLAATAKPNSAFSGWSGSGCGGTGACTVTATAGTLVKPVIATFSLVLRTLTVVKAGTGTGTVTSAPPGIACGPTCSAAFANGSIVTLTATAASGSVFTGWSGGGCAGTAPCMLTLTADVTVTATFAPAVTLAVVRGPAPGRSSRTGRTWR